MLKFKRLPNGLNLPIPSYATPGSAGMDICAADSVLISKSERVLISTGYAVEIPEGYEIQVRPRSGLAIKHGITVLNTPGTIDSDYRGEIKIILCNLGHEDFQVRIGDRVAQLVLAPVVQASIELVENLSETIRAADGFGSTGRN